MMELSGSVLDTLRDGREFALYRSRQHGKSFLISALARGPVQPALASLSRPEHGSPRPAEFDRGRATRPVALACHKRRTMHFLRIAIGTSRSPDGTKPVAELAVHRRKELRTHA
jgi:hypothetical protein